MPVSITIYKERVSKFTSTVPHCYNPDGSSIQVIINEPFEDMALSYYFTLTAPESVQAGELEAFLRGVEAESQRMGFHPTIVINGEFSSAEQKQFARRITHGILVSNPRLKGVALVDTTRVWDYDPERGECCVIPQKGVLLVVTDENADETAFGFLRYPRLLVDANGRELATVPHEGRWYFRNFVDTPDGRYRAIVRMFADAGYLESESDEYASR